MANENDVLDQVWVQVEGFPWWPAVILKNGLEDVSDKEHRKNLKRIRPSKGTDTRVVFFYGTQDYSWACQSKVIPFDLALEESFRATIPKSWKTKWESAVKDATEMMASVMNPEDDDQPCAVCDGQDEPEKMLLCDECDAHYHCRCLDPPLKKVPSGSWFCPDCRPTKKRKKNIDIIERPAWMDEEEDEVTPAFKPATAQETKPEQEATPMPPDDQADVVTGDGVPAAYIATDEAPKDQKQAEDEAADDAMAQKEDVDGALADGHSAEETLVETKLAIDEPLDAAVPSSEQKAEEKMEDGSLQPEETSAIPENTSTAELPAGDEKQQDEAEAAATEEASGGPEEAILVVDEAPATEETASAPPVSSGDAKPQQACSWITECNFVFNSIQIHPQDVRRAHGKRWLNDSLIDFYMQVLQLRAECRERDFIFASTAFQKSVLEWPSRCPRAASRWFKNKSLLQTRAIFIPITIEGNHWAALCVLNPVGALRSYPNNSYPRAKRPAAMLYIDSLKKECPPKVAEGLAVFLHYRYLIEKAKADGQPVPVFKENDPVIPTEEVMQQQRWCQSQDNTPIIRAKVPRQPNSYDCGVYMLHGVETMASKEYCRTVEGLLSDVSKVEGGGGLLNFDQTMINAKRKLLGGLLKALATSGNTSFLVKHVNELPEDLQDIVNEEDPFVITHRRWIKQASAN